MIAAEENQGTYRRDYPGGDVRSTAQPHDVSGPEELRRRSN